MQGTAIPATIYSASSPRLAGRFPDSEHDEIWFADIKACVPGGSCREFKNVMFVETDETVWLYGIEHEDGRPRELKAELADSQQQFVKFVRKQTELTRANSVPSYVATFITRYVALHDLSRTRSANTKVKGASRIRTTSEQNTGYLCEHMRCEIMTSDQDKTGQQGGTAQNNPGNFANDREKASEAGHKGGQASGGNFANDPQRASEAGQNGGQMSGGRSEDQQTGQGSGSDFQEDDLQSAGGATQRGGQGGHTTGSKADREQGMDEGSQAIQDEDSGMTEDNR